MSLRNVARTTVTVTVLVSLLKLSVAQAYEVDSATRKSVSEATKKELVAATPRQQRFSVRFAISGKTPFRDYEKIAKAAGYPPYEDCSVATFVEVTNWQIIQRSDISSASIKHLYDRCEASDTTVLGPKPLSQQVGDREVIRGMWQRSLEFVGKSLRDVRLLTFIQDDATKRFTSLYGDPAEYQLTTAGFVPAAPVVAKTEAPASETTSPEAEKPAAIPQPTDSAANGLFEQLILRTVTRYGLSGVYVENATYMLLNDGSILKEPTDNPYTLNIASSKRQAPKRWGRWRRQGSTLQVTWLGDDPTTWKRWFIVRPAKKGRRISGRFQSADGFGGDRVANFNTVAFSSDGRFSWATLKGGDTPWKPAYSNRKSAGRYELDGNMIRLSYNDGAVREYAFGFYPKDDDHFVIGANHFTRLD
ncbi:MAG: hypothetical protein AAGH76_02865 [Pseudomonadota bacterium]